MNSNTDYYNILGVSENADSMQIRKAYKEKVKQYHPDAHKNLSDSEKNKMEDMFRKVTNAYETLSNEEKRKDYDQLRKSEQTKKENNSFSKYKNNSKTNYYNVFGGGDNIFGGGDNIFSGGDSIFNSSFTNTGNNYNKQRKAKEGNFDDIIEIEKKIKELEEQLLNLDNKKVELQNIIYKCTEEREHLIMKLEHTVRSTPNYIEAQQYINDFLEKASKKLTYLFIPKSQYDKYYSYKNFIDNENSKLEEQRKNLCQTSNELIDNTKNKINETFDLSSKKREELRNLKEKYKRHPSRASYELHKMTAKVENESITKGNKK